MLDGKIAKAGKELGIVEPEIRPIAGFDGYFISQDGDVFTTLARRQRYFARNATPLRKMTATVSSNGYPTVYLYANGKRYLKTVHRLVLLAFVGEPEETHVARHLNGNKLDCKLQNLAWGTEKDNYADKIAIGNHQYGERNASSKLTSQQVLNIRNDPRNTVELAKEYGVSSSLIGLIKRRKRWGHL